MRDPANFPGLAHFSLLHPFLEMATLSLPAIRVMRPTALEMKLHFPVRVLLFRKFLSLFATLPTSTPARPPAPMPRRSPQPMQCSARVTAAGVPSSLLLAPPLTPSFLSLQQSNKKKSKGAVAHNEQGQHFSVLAVNVIT